MDWAQKEALKLKTIYIAKGGTAFEKSMIETLRRISLNSRSQAFLECAVIAENSLDYVTSGRMLNSEYGKQIAEAIRSKGAEK